MIRDSVEGPRGCGYRKPGGLYLVAPSSGSSCGRFPIPIKPCPECERRGIKCGLKHSRGWTWVEPSKTFIDSQCNAHSVGDGCFGCPFGRQGEMFQGRHGLIWIGEKFYKTPHDWLRESGEMGVSRKIKSPPRGFKLGETWVFVAHIKAIMGKCSCCLVDTTPGLQIPREDCKDCAGTGFVMKPAVFQAFKPSAIEYIVTDKETTEELQELEEKGYELVRVERRPAQTNIDGEVESPVGKEVT